MPTVPYAKVLVSVNSAGNTSGGLVVPGAASIALTGENTSQWGSQRWEIYSYPSDFSAPSGWSTDGNGVIFSTAVAPTAFSLPALAAATGWGKYMLRLTVNGGLTNGIKDGTLIDESTALRMTSTRGLRALGFNETTQFGGAREQYAAELFATLRAIEAFASSGGSLPTTVTIVSKSANYTIVASTDNTIECITNTGFTITLPATATAGTQFTVVNNTAGTNTVSGNGHNIAATGAATMVLASQQAVTFTGNAAGTLWLAS